MYDGSVLQPMQWRNYIVGAAILLIIIAGISVFAFVGRGGIVSPIPDTDTVRVIFVTPVPTHSASPSASVEPEESSESIE